MADGTSLNPGVGGDLVSDEDLTAQPRQAPGVPQLGAANANYKLPRSKIAIGAYGQDRGDVDADGRPFPVETPAERRIAELAYLRAIDAANRAVVTRQGERVPAACFARSGRDGRM